MKGSLPDPTRSASFIWNEVRCRCGPDRDDMGETRIKELQHLLLEPGINSGARRTISGAGQAD